MNVLIVGSGAREHALARAAKRSPRVSSVLCAPGNAGIAQDVRCVAIDTADIDAVVGLATQEQVSFVIVGPEAPLVAGLADALRAKGIDVFGPGAAGARLEGSKAYSKDFMRRHGVRTAEYAVFSANTHVEAMDYVRARGGAVVVKASGLAAGKGVVVADNTDEALSAIDAMLRGKQFGDASSTIVVEQRLHGPELSLHVLTDGHQYAVIGAAQDHKRLGDGDQGPNTGGMGAYCPVAGLTDLEMRTMIEQIVEPTIAGLKTDQIDFRGVLFFGVMLHDGVPYLLEYNVRFGDPECAVLLARMSDDVIPAMLATARGQLDAAMVPLSTGAAVAVVIASRGYPIKPILGDVISGLELEHGTAVVLHAGTRATEHGVVTAGGRVLTVTAHAQSFADAWRAAYERVAQISFEGAQFRRDIGWRAGAI